tara:strand:+ start:49 stop:612 length:564 start_codon:yes stop_codon:yes gene_type:complete
MSRKWQTLMKEVDGLIGQSNGHLFERSTRLVAIWDDHNFLDHHSGNVDKAEESLNSKLGDYGLTIFDVKAMLKMFTKKEQWESGNLRGMLAEALAAEESRRQESRAPVVARKGPVARKEFEAVQKSAEVSERRAESLADENARLRNDNGQLRAQLEHANGRIEELERVLGCEFCGGEGVIAVDVDLN